MSDLYQQFLAEKRAEKGLDPITGISMPEGTPEAPETPAEPQSVDVDIADDTLAEIEQADSPDNFVVAVGKGLVNGGIKAGESMASLMAGAMNLPIKGFEMATGQEEPGFRFNASEPTTFDSNTATQDVTTALTQFGLGFYTGGNILRGAKLLQGAGGGAKFANAMTKGAYADFTAFKGDEERLSDFLVTIDNPALNNAVTQYLAGDPDDSDIEGRFKNVIEGAGLGVLADTVFYAAKGLNQGRKALMKGDKTAATNFMVRAKESVGRLMESNRAVIEQIDEANLDAIKPTRMNVNRAESIINQEEFTKITSKIKSWDTPQAYNELDDKISGVVDKDLFETTDDVSAVMDAMSDITVPDFDVWPHEARVEMARTYGMTVEQLQQLKDLGAVNSQALLVSKSMLVDQAAVVARSIDEGLNDDQVLMEMTRYKDLADIFLSFRNESGRVLDSNRIKMAMEEGDALTINEFIGERFGNKMNFAKFKEVLKATGGDPAEVAALMKKSKIEIAADSAIELWKNSILSGIKTFNVNFMGSMVNSTMQIPIRAFEGAAGAVRGGSDRVYMGEAVAMLAADTMSFVDLIGASGRMLRRPKQFFADFSAPHAVRDKAEMGPTRKISSEYWGLGTQPGSVARFVQRMTGDRISAQATQDTMRRALDTVGSVINAPGGALNIQDGFIQNHAMRKEKFALIYRKLRSEKVGAAEFGEKFYQLMDDPEFNRQIAPQLKKFAQRTTFQDDPGSIAKLAQQLQKTKITPLKIPAFEFLLPFVRTPANILKQGVGETLLAPVTTEFYSKIRAGGVARDEAIGRLMFGGSVASLAGTMTLGGQLTGAGPQDPAMRRAWKDAGNMPYSIRIQIGTDPNGNPIYRSYEYGRIEPLSFMIGSIASAIETKHYTSLQQPGKDKDFDEYAAAAINALTQATLDKSFFTGVNDFVLFMSDPERYGPQWRNRLGTSIVPNISRDIETMLQENTYLRDFREFENAWNQKIIGKSGQVPLVRNRWGDPIHKDKGWLLGHRSHFSPIGMDEGYAEPADREINRLAVEGINGQVFREALIAMPDRAIMEAGIRIPLNAEQYSRLIEIAGKEVLLDNLGTGTPMNLRETLNYLVTQSASYKAASEFPSTQAFLIKQMSRGFDSEARRILKEEYPELQKKATEAQFLKLNTSQGLMDQEMRMKSLEMFQEEFR